MRIYFFPSNSRQLQMSEYRCWCCFMKWANPLVYCSVWPEVLSPLSCQFSPSFHKCCVSFPVDRTVAPCCFHCRLYLLDSFAADNYGGDTCNVKSVMYGRLIVVTSEQCTLASCAIIPGNSPAKDLHGYDAYVMLDGNRQYIFFEIVSVPVDKIDHRHYNVKFTAFKCLCKGACSHVPTYSDVTDNPFLLCFLQPGKCTVGPEQTFEIKHPNVV